MGGVIYLILYINLRKFSRMDFLFYLFLIFTNDSLRILMYNVDTNRHIYVCHRPVSFIDDFTLYGNGSFLFSHVLHLLQN